MSGRARHAGRCACGRRATSDGTCPECRARREAARQRVSATPARMGPGRELEGELRSAMEQRLGASLEDIRIHDDQAAAETAAGLGARAYTVGSRVVFGEEQFQPSTEAGRNLLAHELTHVRQQRRAGVAQRGGAATVDAGDSAAEQQARRVARGGSHETPRTLAAPASGPVVQRDELPTVPTRLHTTPSMARMLGSQTLDGFALNSDALTGEHVRILTEHAERLQSLLEDHPGATVRIVGHTDATGGEELNQDLGQRRAEAVRARLEALGVPADAMQADSRGESSLAVETPRAEPRNRRVNIRFETAPDIHIMPDLELRPPLSPDAPPGPPTGPPAPIISPSDFCRIYPQYCLPPDYGRGGGPGPRRPGSPGPFDIPPITPLPRGPSLSEAVCNRVGDAVDGITRGLGLSREWRGRIRDAACAGVGRGARAALDAALDAANVHGESREAIQKAAEAAAETPLPR